MSTTAIDYSEIKSVLKEALIEILQERRDLFQEIFIDILRDSASGNPQNDQEDISDDGITHTIKDIVSHIKATPPNPDLVIHGTRVGDLDYIQALLDNPPVNTISREEWEQLWPKHEAEMKALDVAQALAEGRP